MMRNGILLNSTEVKNQSGRKSGMKNTLQQSVGLNYTRATPKGILISGGLDVGYERYSLVIRNYPFKENLYITPETLNSTYTHKGTIPYAQLNFNIGYRHIKMKKITPEIRVGQIFHFPMGYKNLSAYPEAISIFTGWPDYVLALKGRYGKNASGFIVEFLNNLYIGCKIPYEKTPTSKLTFGINIQRQLFLTSINQ